MSYQVLARKWRPRSFPEMVGQEHVLRALINALDNDRLHHAFLFTGTRGVGKTTVARILAKSLNCEQGVSSHPCGQCSACREIDEGRFIDLIEVDAASRTKVEDTRELLENVQYAPTRGRYKVYLVDEVHMLSNHSFNALLKTLEEPPPHVKFLLATTDPQRLPVTILSRCLQFSLKRLPQDLIRDHLARLLKAEGVEAEAAAVAEIARAADGSMRDALSLLDQAIAYGGGRLAAAEVRDMLGTIDRGRVIALAEAIASADAARVLEEVRSLDEQAPDYAGVLAELIHVLHRVALAQAVPEVVDDSLGDQQAVLQLAKSLTPEDVQLFYQIGLIGRRDLPLAPDPRSGFEMVLLRMLAFRLVEGEGGMPAPPPSHPVAEAATSRPAAQPGPSAPASPAAGAGGREAAVRPASTPELTAESNPEPSRQPVPPSLSPLYPESPAAAVPAVEEPRSNNASPISDWPVLVARLEVGGLVQQLAVNCALVGQREGVFELLLDKTAQHLFSKQREENLRQALEKQLGGPVRLSIRIGAAEEAAATPEQLRRQDEAERQQAAERSIDEDPNVKAMMERFGARMQPGSVRPLE